ncbi:hypothetical protein [uncultured Brevibacillus sp.]|uniref:hypothetical protein n=1 Tax=uncultured Brevibacillus sp. TaxID=169970 RepID=UPI002593265D|nr:hypothetical protein [uncultured Brevibacillus sp.]
MNKEKILYGVEVTVCIIAIAYLLIISMSTYSNEYVGFALGGIFLTSWVTSLLGKRYIRGFVNLVISICVMSIL